MKKDSFFVCERANKVFQVLTKFIRTERQRIYTHISNENAVIILYERNM